jgi:hypothetical protein
VLLILVARSSVLARRWARLLSVLLVLAQLLPAAAHPAVAPRAALAAQTSQIPPRTLVQSPPAPQPGLTPSSAVADAAIPAHLLPDPLQTEVLVIGNPSAFTNDYDLWRYFHGLGWVKQPLPEPGWSWQGIVTDPTNPDHWLLWGYPAGGASGTNGSQLLACRSRWTVSDGSSSRGACCACSRIPH